MDQEDLKKLEDPDEWDFEHGESMSPPKDPRFVVAVTFSKEDFAEVAVCAQGLEEKLTEFIREAAVRRARGSSKSKQTSVKKQPPSEGHREARAGA